MKQTSCHWHPACLLAVTAAVSAWLSVPATAQGKPEPGPKGTGSESIHINANPIATFGKLPLNRKTFGKLEWIGGLRLTSPEKRFGGWSGLAIGPDGKNFVAISDGGTWMTGELAYSQGRPTGISRARIGPLRALNGATLNRNRDRDAESVALASGSLSNGNLLIGFERNHRIGRFLIDRNGVSKPRSYVRPRRPGGSIPSQRGFEAIAILRGGRFKGSLVAIAERKHDEHGNNTGWIWRNGKPRRFTIANWGGHDVTDAAALPDGGLIILERRFRWLEGITFRLRHIPAAHLKPGAEIEGETLLEADLTKVIDNMEALSVHQDANGHFVLTLMSDNNFNDLLQQNLLLQFRWRRDQTHVNVRSTSGEPSPPTSNQD